MFIWMLSRVKSLEGKYKQICSVIRNSYFKEDVCGKE
jgi:hypothetical protein